MKQYNITLNVNDNVTPSDLESAIQNMVANTLNTKENFYTITEEKPATYPDWQYAEIINCTLTNFPEEKHKCKYKNCYILKCNKSDSFFDIDLTGDWFFNTEFDIKDPKPVTTVHSLSELLEFIHDNNLEEPYWTDDHKCIRVGGGKDMIVFPDLTAKWACNTEEYKKYEAY